MPPTLSGPCPQAGRSDYFGGGVQDPTYFAIEQNPVVPRGLNVPEVGFDRVTPFLRWPYHLPAYNGTDCLFWAMLVRASYWRDQTWVRNVAGWSGSILRLNFVPTADPAVQGYALVELADCTLIIIPGTASESEALQYIVRHSMESLTVDPVGGWQINSAWALRGAQVLAAYNAWPPPTLLKPAIVIGHSAGGAYGAYVAWKLKQITDQVATIVTFGAPIWGTESMRLTQQGKPPQIIEFTNPNDPITLVPPPWSLIDALQLGYRLAARPEYKRLANVLLLGGTGRPLPTVGDASDTVTAAAGALVLQGENPGTPHFTSTYTANANLWAENDPTMQSGDWANEYDALFDVLRAMNVAGV